MTQRRIHLPKAWLFIKQCYSMHAVSYPEVLSKIFLRVGITSFIERTSKKTNKRNALKSHRPLREDNYLSTKVYFAFYHNISEEFNAPPQRKSSTTQGNISREITSPLRATITTHVYDGWWPNCNWWPFMENNKTFLTRYGEWKLPRSEKGNEQKISLN